MRYYSRRTLRLTILTGLNLFGSRSHNAVSVTRSCALTAKNSGSKRRHGAPTSTSRLRSSIVKKSGVQEGLVLVNAMHITASVYINDDEQGLLNDYDRFLERIAPHDDVYRHNETGEDNGDAHIKRQVMGREVVVAITNGRLDFGPWEQIFYGEFDGRRKKRVLVKVVGD
jgi:secondary thiamine-phosphate synthase enzyme